MCTSARCKTTGFDYADRSRKFLCGYDLADHATHQELCYKRPNPSRIAFNVLVHVTDRLHQEYW